MIAAADHVWVTLTPWRLAFCETYARMRNDNALKMGRPEMNNASSDPETRLVRHVLGMQGEAALMLYLTRARPMLKWHLYQDGGVLTTLPDFDDWIDVKAAPKNHLSLIIQLNDHEDWAYVLALAEMTPRICLFGWCWGHEAKQDCYRADPVGNRPAYFIKQQASIMRPMVELSTLLKTGRAHA
jgi:hypothetical protein